VTSPTHSENDEDFAALFEETLKRRHKRVQAGQRVTGHVTQVGEKRLVVDLGDGLDAMMELSALGEPGSRPELKVGESLTAYVLFADDRVVELGRAAPKGAGGRRALEDAARDGLPVEGTVLEVNKGGFVVEVSGTRCFCPLAQMDLRRIDEPAQWVGQRHLFKVTELRNARNVVLSRRVLLEEQQAEAAALTRKQLVVGARFRGRVTSVRDFGVFVEFGGLEGMVPARELGYGVMQPSAAVGVGQEMDVEVLRLEPPGKDGKERVTLSVRALEPDPMHAVKGELTMGTVVLGQITRVQPSGAFVELVPGVEGLIHISAFGRRIGHPSEMVAQGQWIAARVENVDSVLRRISLGYVSTEDVRAQGWALPKELLPTPDVAAARSSGEVKTTGKTFLRRAEKQPKALDADVPRRTELRVLGRMDAVEMAPARASKEGGTAEAASPAAPSQGVVFDVMVDRIESFGLFVKWPTGRGLVPVSELGVPRNTDLRRHFPLGTIFKATVMEVRQDGKVRLSKTAVERAEERAETEAYIRRSAPVSGKGFGTLGDLLKAKATRPG
jgi:small subunit ribosomal protein S1